MGGRAVAAAVLIVLLLSGCVAERAPGPVPGRTASSPSGDARLDRFRAVVEAVVRADRDPGGTAFVRALEDAGWPRRDLQVTADRTSVGLDVPAVQFAARDGDDSCLLGQFGRAGLQVERAAPVDGACLVGATRRLD